MSLYGMMRTGVSGMNAQANRLGTVADNIANVLPIYGTNQTRYFGSDGRTWSIGTPRTLGVRLRSSF